MKNKKNKFWNTSVKNNIGELTLYGVISDSSWWGDEITPKDFKADLDALGDIETLNIYINSPGGDVFAGNTIYNMIKRHKAVKNVHIDGLAASIASIIAMAGDNIIMPKNAMMMIHKPWSGMYGNSNDFRKMADDLDKIEGSLVEAYKTKATIEETEIKSLMDAETWLSADDCLKYGLATQIIEEKKMAASISDKLFKNYKHVPKQLEEESQVEDINNELNQELDLLELELNINSSFFNTKL